MLRASVTTPLRVTRRRFCWASGRETERWATAQAEWWEKGCLNWLEGVEREGEGGEGEGEGEEGEEGEEERDWKGGIEDEDVQLMNLVKVGRMEEEEASERIEEQRE